MLTAIKERTATKTIATNNSTDINASENSTINNYSASIISAVELSLGYEDPQSKRLNYVLKNLSINIQAGAITALLGPSGVGKSSLLRVLAGLQKPQNGSVLFHDKPLKQPSPELGFVFQEHSLLPWLNLEENVSFGLDFKHQHKLSKSEIKQRVDLAISEVGLNHARKRFPSELSGGMAQRVSLARCLARSAKILLLDEPFSALDEITRAEMQQLLLTINKRRNTAAVLVTHDIDEALLVSDRILLVGGEPGRLLQDWQINLPQPRELIDPAMVQLRIEILQTLKEARL